MPYNPIEYLKQGNIDFVDRLTTYDRENLILRIRKSSEREEIIGGCIDKLKDKNYTFRDHQETWSYISKYPSFDIQSEVLMESLERIAPEIENANNTSKQRRKQK